MFRNPFADGIVILIVLLLFFGPKRLPMLSRSIGESIREFKGGIDQGDAEKTPEVNPAAAEPAQGATGAAGDAAQTGASRTA